MKITKVLAMAALAMTLVVVPAEAQRPGGGGGGRSGSSSSSSRSSSSSSSSRSSSSMSSSRSSSSASSSRSSSSIGSSRSSSQRSSSAVSTPRGRYESSRPTTSRESGVSHRAARTSGAREAGVVGQGRPTTGSVHRGGAPSGSPQGGRPGTMTPTPHHGHDAGYARPGRPGTMPPSSRPIHPAPYFHHPWHGYVVHCHPIFWEPIPPRPWYWPGFWMYCNNYWYDYHVTDVVVVHDYVQKTYSVDLVTYGISGDIMYAIVKDGGNTYLQVYDKEDHLLAEQKINKKYCNMVIDAENGGCWISKKNNKDPLLFIWAEGQLLIYEED